MALGRLLLLSALVFAPSLAKGLPLWQEQPAAKVANATKAETLPDFTRLAHASLDAVVSISTVQKADPAEDPIRSLIEPEGGEPQKGLGSGFLIHPDGYFVTNAHVVEDATGITVTARRNGHQREYAARIVGVDPPTDIALMKIDADEGETFPTLPLGDSEGLQVAEWIAVIGNPYGLASSVTVGVVSYKGRTDVMPAGREGYYDYIQTDASINPGNSGGPILNARGEVVAVANAVNAVGQGIGFAIPINMAKAVLVPLLREGRVRRSWLGLAVEDLTPEAARERNLPRDLSGVLVSDVTAGAPGERAGVKAGDVVLDFNGTRVRDAQRLRWLAASGGAGREVPMRVYRGGQELALTVLLQPLPEEKKTTVAPALAEMGLVVSPVDVPAARHAGLALPLGAVVTEVREGSPARRAGLSKGDLILKVDDLEIHTTAGLARAMAKVEKGDFARLVIRRANQTLFLAVRKPG